MNKMLACTEGCRQVQTEARLASVRKAVRKWRLNHPDRHRDGVRKQLARRNGFVLPPKEKECPPRPIDGRCQICGRVPQTRLTGRSGSPGGLQLDHDHKTGRFRGWLCIGCNIALGRIERLGMSRFEQYLLAD
jgi:hypothetical protein